MTSNNATSFDLALEDFKAGLRRKDRDRFQSTTRDDLLQEMENLQKQQHSQRLGTNLARLRPFLEAMGELGKVVEVFSNTSSMVAFVWGPMKLLLQVTSSFSRAFQGLLEVYEKIGESVPLLKGYESLFKEDQNMRRILSITWKDILEFHRQALKYFQQPMWKKVFHATWDTYKSRFGPLINSIREHGVLIQNQATLSHIEDFRKTRNCHDIQMNSILEKLETQRLQELSRLQVQETQRLRDLSSWLQGPNVENEQAHYSRIRRESPGTGGWLLEDQCLKEWIDPQYPTIPPLLWMNGMPGAGKTILSSLVIEEVQKLNPPPVLLYFFCKHGDNERNNFISLARSFLSQMMENSMDSLVPYFYEEYSKSREPILTTHTTIQALLEVALQNCPSVYIVVDGIDECARDQRRAITQWFRHLVEDLRPPRQDRVRCLFVSQDDGLARKDFTDMQTLKIERERTMTDIEKYSLASAAQIQHDLGIADDMTQHIAEKVQMAADGMFLLAKLIVTNLSNQISVEDLEVELQDDELPRELTQAYSKIISRVFDQASPSQKRASRFILQWLVCAKRTIKWNEIQAARAVDIENQTVDHEKRRFRAYPKDLCGSLVEERDDGTVEFVHTTAKFFLVEKSQNHLEYYVDAPHVNLTFATLCVDYLNLDGFRGGTELVRDRASHGYYAFMDYAVPYWFRHLESASSEAVDESEASLHGINTIAESLDSFLSIHFVSPTKQYSVSQGNLKRLSVFEPYHFYQELQKAVISARKEVSFYGEMKAGEMALNLTALVKDIRDELEALYAKSSAEDEKRLQEIYGKNIFKCPRLSCRYFYNGFSTAEERDRHMDKHLRPFRCGVIGCPSATLGMSTAKELSKHKKEHDVCEDDEIDFPEEKVIGNGEPRKTKPQLKRTATKEPRPKSVKVKRPRITEFPCEHCGKVYNKKYNLDSHLVTHSDSRDFVCHRCGAGFARVYDRDRHQKIHEEKTFICGGTLKNGQSWGCQKKFARADTLQSHHNTAFGRNCIRPWEDEQRAELLYRT